MLPAGDLVGSAEQSLIRQPRDLQPYGEVDEAMEPKVELGVQAELKDVSQEDTHPPSQAKYGCSAHLNAFLHRRRCGIATAQDRLFFWHLWVFFVFLFGCSLVCVHVCCYL